MSLLDLTREQQADPVAVLRVLKAEGGFSAFDASNNAVISKTITNMIHKGLSLVRDGVRTDYGKLIEVDNSCGYPISRVRITAAGERLLADADALAATQGASHDQ